jgi:hypothetical protein
VAEMPANTGLACPPQLKSINTRRGFLLYIPTNRVTETIHFRCVKKEKKEEEKPGLLVLLLEIL